MKKPNLLAIQQILLQDKFSSSMLHPVRAVAMLLAIVRAFLMFAALSTVLIFLIIYFPFRARCISGMTCRVIARWELDDDLKNLYDVEAAGHRTQT